MTRPLGDYITFDQMRRDRLTALVIGFAFGLAVAGTIVAWRFA